MSENKANMVPRSGGAQNRLSPDRIDFFKGTHHQIGNSSWGFMAEPSSKSAYIQHDLKARPNLNEKNNAYNLRHHIHDYGQIGKQASNYVTESQMRQKWIQPRTVA